MQIYFIEFDIAAICILVSITAFYFTRKHFKDVIHYISASMFVCATLMPVFDIISAYLIENGKNKAAVFFATEAYYIFMHGITFFFLSFVIYQLETEEHISSIKMLFIRLPILVFIIIVLSNPFTKWIFDYSIEKGYHTGPLQFISYVLAFFYFGWSVLFVTLKRNDYDTHLRYAVYNICIVNFISVFSQLFLSKHMVISFGFAISMMLLFISSSTKNSLIDQNTGMLNREILGKQITKKYYNHESFVAIIVRIADYDQLTGIYGIPKIEPLVRQVALCLEGFVGIGNAFQTNNSTFVLFTGDLITAKEFVQAIDDKLSASFDIDGEIIPFSHLVTTLECPGKAKDVDDFNAYLTYFEKMKKMRYGIVPTEELMIRDKVRETLVERAIRRGLDNGNLLVYYQPICTADDKKFVSAEALLRLIDDELGFISPAEFVPVAERSGLMIEVGNYVIESVCRYIKENDLEALGVKYIEVNLSVVQCLQRDFMEFINAVVDKYDIDTSQIIFEITETAANCSPDIFTRNLDALDKSGFSLALDDFGTGYGNLQRMITSPFSIVKFDKEMIHAVCESEELEKVFATMVPMFKAMQMEIVAEGVETEEQYRYLKEVGIDYIQGYYFSKPLPDNEYLSFLKNA